LLLALSACSSFSPPPPPRTNPDQVERAAVASAQRAAQYDGIPIADNAGGLSYTVILIPKSTTVDGGVGPPFFDSSTAQRLIDGCVAEFPVDFRLFSVPPRDREALYAYDLTVLRRCLLSHGQPVGRMPTRARFESLLRGNTPWNAYEQVRVTTRAEWYALVDACPALPPAIAGDVAAITTSATTP